MAELHLYDFDSTLFRSPHQPAIWDGDWWSDPASLMEPCVPDRPNKGWWIPYTVEKAKKSISDPNVFAVMMTGRKDNSAFRYRVPELLKQQRLTFDAVHLTPKTAKSAKKYKIEQVLRYLQQYPQIKKVQIWDDRKSHLQFFERVLRHFGYRVETHFVHEYPASPSCAGMEGVSGPKLPKKVNYVGIFLTGESKRRLIHRFGGYTHDVPKAEHITLGFKLTPEMQHLLGETLHFTVVGAAEDADGQAVVVDLGENSHLFKKKGVPHITISHSDRVAPKYSNELLAKGSTAVPPMLFRGVLDTFPSSFTREVVRDNPRRRKMRRSKRGPLARRNTAPAKYKYVQVIFAHPDDPSGEVVRHRLRTWADWNIKDAESQLALEETLAKLHPDLPEEHIAKGVLAIGDDDSIRRWRARNKNTSKAELIERALKKFGRRWEPHHQPRRRAEAIVEVYLDGPVEGSANTQLYTFMGLEDDDSYPEGDSVYDHYTPAQLGISDYKTYNNPRPMNRRLPVKAGTLLDVRYNDSGDPYDVYYRYIRDYEVPEDTFIEFEDVEDARGRPYYRDTRGYIQVRIPLPPGNSPNYYTVTGEAEWPHTKRGPYIRDKTKGGAHRAWVSNLSDSELCRELHNEEPSPFYFEEDDQLLVDEIVHRAQDENISIAEWCKKAGKKAARKNPSRRARRPRRRRR